MTSASDEDGPGCIWLPVACAALFVALGAWGLVSADTDAVLARAEMQEDNR